MMRRRGFSRDDAGLLTGCECGVPDEAHYREVMPHGSDARRLLAVVCRAIERGVSPRPLNRRAYGDGVGLEPAWRCPRVFMLAVLDLGWKPGLTLERQDNGRGYFPDNLTLATRAEQNRNMRSNRRFSTGEIATDAATRLGFRAHGGVVVRIKAGWPEPLALSIPAHGGRLRPARLRRGVSSPRSDDPRQVDASASWPESRAPARPVDPVRLRRARAAADEVPPLLALMQARKS